MVDKRQKLQRTIQFQVFPDLINYPDISRFSNVPEKEATAVSLSKLKRMIYIFLWSINFGDPSDDPPPVSTPQQVERVNKYKSNEEPCGKFVMDKP